MTSGGAVLTVEETDKIAVVTLNRPEKRNALSEDLWRNLKSTFENFQPRTKAVVLAGCGTRSTSRPSR